MILGMTTFTLAHVVLSLIGILSGFVVVFGLFASKRLDSWNAVFLASTVLTSVTGFFFPFHRLLPSHVLGILSLITLAIAIPARYSFHLAGAWRKTYVIAAVIAFYFNFFVLVAQLFMKVPALKALAPTQSEPPFQVTQLIALVVFARRRHKRWLEVTDFVAPLCPLGLAAGRLGNFINGELWGRPSTLPWAMVFPQVDAVPRHPSQLYEFGLEGLALFALVWLYARRRRPVGAVSGLFLVGYGCFRFLVEYAREPDDFLGVLTLGWTMGQWLSLPMIVAGVGLMAWAYWRAGKTQPTLFGP